MVLNQEYKVDVPVGYTYYLAATSNNDEYVSYEIKQIGVDSESIEDYEVNFEFILAPIQYYTISGYVYDQNAEPVYDAEVNVESSDMSNMMVTEIMMDGMIGYTLMLQVIIQYLFQPAYMIWALLLMDFCMNTQLVLRLIMMLYRILILILLVPSPVLYGCCNVIGDYTLDEPVYIEVESNLFSASVYADENGFFY